MIERQIQNVIHYLPQTDPGRHLIHDGVWCWCAPSAELDEDDDLLPIHIRHVSWGNRVRRVFQP